MKVEYQTVDREHLITNNDVLLANALWKLRYGTMGIMFDRILTPTTHHSNIERAKSFIPFSMNHYALDDRTNYVVHIYFNYRMKIKKNTSQNMCSATV